MNLRCQAQPRYFFVQNHVPPIKNLNTLDTYNYIQDAIDDANSGDIIEARPWIYPGSIIFNGKNITLRSIAPANAGIVASTVINDRGTKTAAVYYALPREGAVVNFKQSEDANCIVNGFTIVSENEIYSMVPVRCSSGAGPTLINCVITQKKATDIYTVSYCPSLMSCYPVRKAEAVMLDQTDNIVALANCVLAGNAGGGITAKNSLALLVSNCTIVGNGSNGIYSQGTTTGITNSIIYNNIGPSLAGDSLLPTIDTVNYNNIKGGFAGGSGNIGIDPRFVNPGYWDNNDTPADYNDDTWHGGNYRLTGYSACIDTADNNSVPADIADLDGDANTAELTPYDIDGRDRFVDGDCNDSEITDMGAFEFAWQYAGDFDAQCDVDFVDFSVLGSTWLLEEQQAGYDPNCDIGIPNDGVIDRKDLEILAANWLAGAE